ncbi:MAG: hypothetical protein BWY28_01886 [bacterium ADurb.Bin236]|nr:MAG: hypothetical protein BWY28_01886 [bacterium ADurb.Bin236]
MARGSARPPYSARDSPSARSTRGCASETARSGNSRRAVKIPRGAPQLTAALSIFSRPLLSGKNLAETVRDERAGSDTMNTRSGSNLIPGHDRDSILSMCREIRELFLIVRTAVAGEPRSQSSGRAASRDTARSADFGAATDTAARISMKEMTTYSQPD